METWFSIVILILLVFLFIISIVFNIVQYFINAENKEYLKIWLKSEVEAKRNFSKLSESLKDDRNDYKKKYYSLIKRINKFNKYIKSFAKWRIDKDTLIKLTR